MELENMLINDGYVGSFGIEWKTPTQDDLEKAITGAMAIEEKSREEIISLLESRKTVRWCKSSNFYYDHSYGKLGTKRTSTPAEMVRCDCGHTVAKNQAMNASTGTSCPDCYDRMSE